jgi:phosphoserine aminotransferase
MGGRTVDRVFNFASGPAALPLEALQTAAAEMANFRKKGVSVMEMSHRSAMYLEIFDETVALIKELMSVPDNYAILLLQGGATQQFSAIPMNLMTESRSADYIDSGYFANSAYKEARKYGTARRVASSQGDGYAFIPEWDRADFNVDADYLYITTNNTIYGTRFTRLPETGGVPLVADMSSNILSEQYDVSDFGVIFASAQKNLGPAGFTLMIVKRNLLGRSMAMTPKIMDWEAQAQAGSMLNTPPTYAIYIAGLCLKWLKAQGGVPAIERINIEKAQLLYDYLDESALFKPAARADCRSRMNVTFKTGDADADAAFVRAADGAGFINLAGHRLAGGMRASIYNAMPLAGVAALVAFMKEYEAHV